MNCAAFLLDKQGVCVVTMSFETKKWPGAIQYAGKVFVQATKASPYYGETDFLVIEGEKE